MTEEFWQSYKKNKDKQQSNILWKNVMPFFHSLRSLKEFVEKLSEKSIRMSYTQFVGQIITIGDITEHQQSYL